MTIKVKFFASLRDSLNLEQIDVGFSKNQTVEDIWNVATNNSPLPNNVLSSVNLEHCDFNTPVKSGDEVAFFPPVTGG
jgi:molybdopterin synthase sulfur carrier subunit